MIGQIVSHYRITKQLGAGGMGVVYEAVDTRLDRRVALKFLPPETTRDPQAKARFIHEAKAASALDHHNICNIHEIDATGDGNLFIVMACYEGETLKDRIARGPLSVNEAVEIARQAAAGLFKAHEREIVHRDVKPANIFITSDGVVKILDFGLAKLATGTMLTRPGATLGTVNYMSPEQARGEVTDQRTDLWSLGVVLYEMITGCLPFTGDHGQAVIYSLLNTEPPPVGSLRSGVPEETEQVVNRCLAKDPQQRYVSAADLLGDLGGDVALPVTGDPALARTISLGPVGDRKPPVLRWTILAVVVLAVGIVAWTLMRGGGIDRPGPTLAVVDFTDLVTPDDLHTSTCLMGLLYTGMIENSPVRVISPEFLHDLKLRMFTGDQGAMGPGQALQVAREAGATFLLTGQIARVEGRQIVTWRLVDAVGGSNLVANRVEDPDLIDLADRLIADSVARIRQVLNLEPSGPQIPVAQITTSSPEAYGHYLAGVTAIQGFRGDDAKRELHRAVEIDSTFALPYVELCQYWFYRSDEKRDEYWNKAWQLRDRLGIKDLMRLEMIKERMKSPADFHHVLRVYEEMLARCPNDRVLLRDLVMITSAEQGNQPKALEYALKGLASYPDDLKFLERAAGGPRYAGDYEGALAIARDWVAKYPLEPNAWDELGLDWLGVAEFDSAENAFRRALEIEPDFWFANRHLAVQYYCRGDISAAVGTYTEWVSDGDTPPSNPNYTSYGGRPLLVQFYQDSGQWDNARDLFRRSLADSPSSSTEYGYILFLLTIGEPEEALARLRNLTDPWPQHHQYLEGKAFVALDSLPAVQAIADTLYVAHQRYGSHVPLINSLNLQARISLAQGEPEAALATLAEITAVHGWFPGFKDIEIRRLQARALRQAGRPAEAAEVLMGLLRQYAGHGQAHYELGKIYEEMGRDADALQEYAAFLEAWAGADEGMPPVEEARVRLAALKVSR